MKPLLKQLYKDFLSIVRKNRVGTVIPSEFAMIYNQAQEEVIANKLAVFDINKKIVNDLTPLMRSIKNVDLEKNNDQFYSYYYKLPNNFRRERRVSVNIDNKNVLCSLLKSNMETEILSNVYMKPNYKRCYYKIDIIGENSCIVVYVPETKEIKFYLDYFIEPKMITEDEVISDTEISMFDKELTTEIINVAARMYIERVQDIRYKTMINELQQKNTNQ